MICRDLGWKKTSLLFLLSQAITLFGSTIAQMAIVWYVTLQTSSGAWVAAVTVCGYLPQFFMSFVGGAWADRYPRKWLIAGADGLIAGVTLVVILAGPLLGADRTFLGALLLVSALRSLGAGIQTPAVNAVIPQLVPEGQRMRYNGINGTMQAVAQFAAPGAAGLILSLGTLGNALLADVLTAVVGIGLLACLQIPSGERGEKEREQESGSAAGTQRKLRRLLAIYGLFVFCSVPAGFLAQLLVSRVYGDTYWHLTAVELTGFAGMALGGGVMGLWGEAADRSRTLGLGLAAFGGLSALLGLVRWFPLYLTLIALYGVALTGVQTTILTLLQETAPPALHGQVFGRMGAIYAGALPLGMAVFGPMADWIPLPWIMAAAGGILMVAAMGPFRKPVC